MTKEDLQEINEKLQCILVEQGIQGEAINGIRGHTKNIDKHLEKQNSSIDKSKIKLANHDVWIKIVSVVVLALLAGFATSVF